MKPFTFLVFLVLALPFSAGAETLVREEPLTWDKTASLPGDQLYQNLCAACHGIEGQGGGMASVELGIGAPGLTGIAADNGGVFPHKQVERSIANSTSTGLHADSAMPKWEQQFSYFRTGLTAFQREAYTRNRIHELTEYIETLQVMN